MKGVKLSLPIFICLHFKIQFMREQILHITTLQQSILTQEKLKKEKYTAVWAIIKTSAIAKNILRLPPTVIFFKKNECFGVNSLEYLSMCNLSNIFWKTLKTKQTRL